MSDLALYLGLLAGALALFGLGYGFHAAQMLARDKDRKLAQMQAALEQQAARIDDLQKRAEPTSKHDLKYLVRQDVGEAVLFDLSNAREQVEMLTQWIEYASQRAAHVARGGNPDDPPTKWKNGDTK